MIEGGRFSDLVFLGEGGMGRVYSALDDRFGERVALKTIPSASPDLQARLKREFRWASWFTMELLRGVHLDEWVRRDLPVEAPLDMTGLARFHACIAQLIDAICALHDNNVVHRDIKPANVMVVGGQRVVLLDLGIADHPILRGDHRRRPELVGTAHYIPPEGWEGVYEQASDWYALGVLTYRLLTGTTPFDGGIHQVHHQKTDPDFTRLPSDTAGLVPKELDRLVGRMLAPDPADRPTRAEIIAGLAPERTTTSSWERLPVLRFVGRERELEALASALEPRADGRPRVVVVRGVSGSGKTRLVEHALARWQQRTEGDLLQGRCHPYESVPFKALDAVVDEISELLRQPGNARLMDTPPPHLGELLRLFPSLIAVSRLARVVRPEALSVTDTWWEDTLNARLEVISQPTLEQASTPLPATTDVDDADRRQRAFSAFRGLLDQIAGHTRLAIWIDDLQWSDADSEALLAEVLTGPQPPGLPLVLCQRSEARTQGGIRIDEDGRLVAAPAVPTTLIELGPLAADHAFDLLEAVQGSASLEDADARAVIDAAGGSPLLLRELARDPEGLVRARDQGPDAVVTGMLARRLEQLSPGHRRVVELTSLCGGPLAVEICLRAAGLPAAERPVLDQLADRGLLRVTSVAGQVSVAPFHARIAEAIVSTLDEPTVRGGHLRLLRAFEAGTGGTDPEVLLRHAVGAGEERQSSVLALAAAERALTALAFHRAAELYRFVLALGYAQEQERVQLGLAEALALAGRGPEAGQAFEDAAALPTLADDALMLQRKAAEQYLKSGHLNRGREVLLGVLRAHGIDPPKHRRSALAQAMAGRMRFLLRGTRFTRTQAEDCDPVALERLDALWVASTSFAVVDHHLADAMAARHLLEALTVGEPARVARALGFETCAEGILPGQWFERRAMRLGREADDIAVTTGRPHDLAFTLACTGTVHWSRGRWAACAERCERTVRAYREVGYGVDWNLGLTFMYLLSAWAWAGALGPLRTETRRLLDSARARGDRFTETMVLTGQPSLTWLAQDRAESALNQADAIIAEWEADGFHTQHYHHLIAGAQACLYLDRPDEAWQRLDESWPDLVDSMILTIDAIKCEMWHLRGRTALACLAAETGDAVAQRKVLKKAIRVVSGTAMPQAPALAALLRAGAAGLEADQDAVRTQLRLARPVLLETGTAVYAAATRAALAQLDGRAEPWTELFLSGEVVRPDRLAAVLLPGLLSLQGV